MPRQAGSCGVLDYTGRDLEATRRTYYMDSETGSLTPLEPRFDPLKGKPLTVFVHYAVPSVVGILAATSAGVIDGIFIGNFVGATALAAVNISMPAFYLLVAIAFMLAVGGSVVCGKYIGEGNMEAASLIFSKTLYASTAIALLVVAPALFFLDQVVSGLGANEELRPLVFTYMQIILWASPLLIIGLTMDYFVRVDGRPLLASGAMVSFAVINITLDWLFVVRWGWGIKGAAWATALADVCFALILSTHFVSSRCHLHLKKVPARFKKGWDELFKAAYNGFSEFANETSVGLVTLLFNWVIITRMGVEGVAAFTVIGYLLMIGTNIGYGISESLQPTVSKNLGARQPDRIVSFFKLALVSSLSVGLVFSTLLILAPAAMINVFLDAGETSTRDLTLTLIAVFWPAFLFNGMNITLAGYFTSLHRPLPSSAIALSRSLLLPAAGLMLLPQWFGDRGVFMALPIAEGLTFLLGMALVWHLKPSQVSAGETR